MTLIPNCPVCDDKAILRFKLTGYNVYYCPSCTHEFSADFDFDLSAIYTKAYFNDQHANWFNHPDTALFDHVTGFLDSIFRKDPRIIDIGCGNGNFLKYLLGKGYRNLTGLDIVEVNIPGVAMIKNHVESFYSLEEYDVAISMANIEHVCNLHEYIHSVWRLLLPGGFFIVYTVNSQSLLYGLAKLCCHLKVSFPVKRLYDAHHVHHFSLNSLNLAVEKGGFKHLSSLKRNLPMTALDLPRTSINGVLRSVIKTINICSDITHRQMLQLAVFQKK